MSFAFKVLAKSPKLYLTSEAFLNYRQDNESSSVKECDYEKLNLVDVEYREIKRYLVDINKYYILEEIYNTTLLFRYLWNTGRVKNIDCKKYIKHISSAVKQLYLSGHYDKSKFNQRQLLMLWMIRNNYIELIKGYHFLKKSWEIIRQILIRFIIRF